MPITSIAPGQAAACSSGPNSTAPAPPAKVKPAAAKSDTVELSSAAQATLAALKEASETPAQTAQEAGGGDAQAQRLLATEAENKLV